MKFSQWLKLSRKEAGLTLVQLRERINNMCTDAYLSRLEHERYVSKKGQQMMPARDLVIALAEAFGKDVDEALTIAGYSPSVNIPDNLIIEGFEGLDQGDIDKIVEYIRFTKEQKKKDK